jgi:fibronectin type 3 domain-containing protein
MLVASLAFAQSTATVTLAWDDTANTGHTGYNLYRKRGQAGTFALVKTVTASDKTTTDTLPVGQIYCYVAMAYITEGTTTIESPRSNEVCTAVLRAPVSLRIQ